MGVAVAADNFVDVRTTVGITVAVIGDSGNAVCATADLHALSNKAMKMNKSKGICFMRQLLQPGGVLPVLFLDRVFQGQRG